MTRPADGLYAALVQRGMTRRAFLKFSAAMTAALALPPAFGPRIAAAVEAAPRLPLVWLRGQACGGNSEAFLRAPDPTTTELLLQLLSVDYIDAIMVASGSAAEAARTGTISRYRDGYLLVVEGAIPTADGGTACTIAGRPLADLVREVSAGALATIAVGSCAFDGGISAAAGGQTGAIGAGKVASGRLINLPGCPVNAANLAATIVHYLTFKELPATDGGGRPLFAYGALVHNECERRAHFEFGEFVHEWGDEGAQKGWCLYRMGCKGPETFANCASVGFDGGLSWPVKAGAGCIGCAMPGFWDAMSPFSRRLPSFVPFLPDVTADQVGIAAVGAVGGAAAVHAVGSYIRARRQRPADLPMVAEAGAAPTDGAVGEPMRAAAPVVDATAAAAPVGAPAAAIEAPVEPQAAAPPAAIEAPVEPQAAEAINAPATPPAAEASAEAPTAEAPSAEAPTAGAPTAEAPTAEAPTAEAPGLVEPVAAEPASDAAAEPGDDTAAEPGDDAAAGPADDAAAEPAPESAAELEAAGDAELRVSTDEEVRG